ncbi:MAG: hypothetical protein U9P50_03165 [Patescibacteria group bacterium]|nr:hypothetical protein [Patescibacteria group bacterium]
MTILNPLPELLSYAFLAPLLLRLVIGFYFLEQFSNIINIKYVNKTEINVSNTFKYLIGLKTLAALALIIGFYTQIAVLILIVLIIFDIYLEQKTGKIKKTKIQFYTFIIAILLTLLTTGAGFFAIDMPL